MIEPKSWMEGAVAALKDVFGGRLLFVGLQGSYRRGEATGQSDIDILTVLDRVDLADLEAYRRALRRLPEGEKACGFTCGQRELHAWPRYELFQLARETDAYHGTLDGLLPPVSQSDITESVRVGAANLYHATAHTYISEDEDGRGAQRRALCKSAFFLLQMAVYLRDGVYCRTRRELDGRLDETERALLVPGDGDALFGRLLGWCGALMEETQ